MDHLCLSFSPTIELNRQTIGNQDCVILEHMHSWDMESFLFRGVGWVFWVKRSQRAIVIPDLQPEQDLNLIRYLHHRWGSRAPMFA